MDFAKELAGWRAQLGQWRASSRHAPSAVTAILVIVIAHQLAALTWALAPRSGSEAAPATRAPLGVTAPVAPALGANYAALLTAHLFGEAAEQSRAVVAQVADAPDTTLRLTLTGILSKDGDPNGSVLIRNGRSEERSYYVGQAIDGADGATLHSVYPDRALLNRSGRLETLRLPKDPSASNGTPMGVAPSQSQLSAVPLRDVIGQNGAGLTNVIRPALHVAGGQVVGFRVNPGRDRATFDALGFRAGDVVTDVNGTVLDDASQGLQIFESLGESTQANVTVLRDGIPQVLVIDTTQLQGLQQNRE